MSEDDIDLPFKYSRKVMAVKNAKSVLYHIDKSVTINQKRESVQSFNPYHYIFGTQLSPFNPYEESYETQETKLQSST